MKVKSESELAQSCLTLSDPMDCSLPGSSIHGIFQARVLEWGAIKRSQTVVNYKQVKRKHDKIHTYPSHCFNSCQRFASPKGSEQRNDSVTPVLEEDASKCDEKRRAGHTGEALADPGATAKAARRVGDRKSSSLHHEHSVMLLGFLNSFGHPPPQTLTHFDLHPSVSCLYQANILTSL